jgi:hypothetical protein
VHPVLWGIGRIVLTVCIGVVTFWPEYGLLMLAIKNYGAYPIPISMAALCWTCVVALQFPIPRTSFQIISTICFVGLLSIAAYQTFRIYPHFFAGPTEFGVVGVIILSAAVGWWRVATSLWRWAHGVAPVEDAAAADR